MLVYLDLTGIEICGIINNSTECSKEEKDMGKYRKKPVVIEAIQYLCPNYEEVRKFIGEETAVIDGDIIIPTLEGLMYASHKDWIIKGVQGEVYPCKPDIFEKTYEKVK